MGIVKTPSRSAAAPIRVPLTIMLAAGSEALVSLSVTFPLITPVAAIANCAIPSSHIAAMKQALPLVQQPEHAFFMPSLFSIGPVKCFIRFILFLFPGPSLCRPCQRV